MRLDNASGRRRYAPTISRYFGLSGVMSGGRRRLTGRYW